MFSGTGELARAIADGLNEFTCFQSFSDNYGPARKYLKVRFRNVEIHSDFREQIVPEGSIVTIEAPRQDLSVAGKRAEADRADSPVHALDDGAALPRSRRLGLSLSAQRRLAGNAVVGLQARLTAINNERNL